MTKRKRHKCCCYYSPNIGAMVIGSICIMMSFLGFLITLKVPLFGSAVKEIQEYCCIRPLIDLAILITSGCLIYGARTKRITFLLPWLTIMIAYIPASAVISIVELVLKNYGNFVYQLIITALLTFFWIEIFLFIREVRWDAKGSGELDTMATARKTRRNLRKSMAKANKERGTEESEIA